MPPEFLGADQNYFPLIEHRSIFYRLLRPGSHPLNSTTLSQH